MTVLQNDLFLRVLQGEDTARAPMWFMRQAGRYLPEYRALKEKHSFWQMARTPELAAEVTLQPVRRYAIDAAILFQDIMTPLSPMGVDIEFNPGPVIGTPIRTLAQIEALRVPEIDEITPFVGEAIRLIRSDCRVPLIGFGGAPLTLATYLIEGSGSKDYAQFRRFLRAEPKVAHALLEKLTEVSIRYLTMQVRADAQAIQLFDSWAGLHDIPMYEAFSKPYNRRIFEALRPLGVPLLYLAVDCTHLYPTLGDLPCDAISIDWRTPIHVARAQLGHGKVIQGNLDPAALLGPPDSIRQAASVVLRSGLGGPHVFNLGHGMLLHTPPDHVTALVDTVLAFDRRAEHRPD